MSNVPQTSCLTLKTHLFLLRGKACSSGAGTSSSLMINLLYYGNRACDVCGSNQTLKKKNPNCIWMQTTHHQVSTNIISSLPYLRDRIQIWLKLMPVMVWLVYPFGWYCIPINIKRDIKVTLITLLDLNHLLRFIHKAFWYTEYGVTQDFNENK